MKELRLEKNMLQSDLGVVMHLAPSTISSWERGNSFPNIEELKQLADFFDVTADYLLGRTDIY